MVYLLSAVDAVRGEFNKTIRRTIVCKEYVSVACYGLSKCSPVPGFSQLVLHQHLCRDLLVMCCCFFCAYRNNNLLIYCFEIQNIII